MVLIVFLVLLIISLILYFKFSYSTIKETQGEILDEKYSTLVNAIVNLPELKCSIRNSEKECLDAKKMMAFGKTLMSIPAIREKYSGVFGVKQIFVEVVYPEYNGIDCVEFSGGDYLNFDIDACSSFNLFSAGDEEGLRYTTPVLIYFPILEEYRMGKLTIIAENV